VNGHVRIRIPSLIEYLAGLQAKRDWRPARRRRESGPRRRLMSDQPAAVRIVARLVDQPSEVGNEDSAAVSNLE